MRLRLYSAQLGLGFGLSLAIHQKYAHAGIAYSAWTIPPLRYLFYPICFSSKICLKQNILPHILFLTYFLPPKIYFIFLPNTFVDQNLFGRLKPKYLWTQKLFGPIYLYQKVFGSKFLYPKFSLDFWFDSKIFGPKVFWIHLF